MRIKTPGRAFASLQRDARLYMVATTLMGFAVFGGIYTVLLNLYLVRLGYGPQEIGLTNAVGQLAMATFSLPAAGMGRRWGSRKMLLAGLVLAFVGHGLLPLAEFSGALRLAYLRGAYLLANAGIALYMVNSNPFLMSVTREGERSRSYAIQGAAYPLSAVAGSLVAGILPGVLAGLAGVGLDRPDGYRNLLWLATLVLAPAAAAILLTQPEQSETLGRRAMLPRERAPLGLMVLFAVFVLLRVSGEGTLRGFFNVYLDVRLAVPTSLIGLWFAAGQFLAALSALAMPFVAAHLGKKRTVVWGTLGMATSLLLVALVPHQLAAGPGYAGLVLLTGVTRPLTTLYQMEAVPSYWRTAMSGWALLATGVSWATMAGVGGFIVATAGYQALFLLGVGLTSAGALLFQVYFGEHGRRPRGSTPIVKQSINYDQGLNE